jgi:hypothetical protein
MLTKESTEIGPNFRTLGWSLGLSLSRRLEYNAMLVGLQMRLMVLYSHAA